MAVPTTAELARQTASEFADLKKDVELLLKQTEQLKLNELPTDLAVLNHRLAQIEKAAEDLRIMPVLTDRVNKLEKHKEEADRRYWQFVVLFVGGILTLAINLVVSFVRK